MIFGGGRFRSCLLEGSRSASEVLPECPRGERGAKNTRRVYYFRLFPTTPCYLRKLTKALTEEIEVEIRKEGSGVLAPLSVMLNTIK